jgi:hypothetical protein
LFSFFFPPCSTIENHPMRHLVKCDIGNDNGMRPENRRAEMCRGRLADAVARANR